MWEYPCGRTLQPPRKHTRNASIEVHCKQGLDTKTAMIAMIAKMVAMIAVVVSCGSSELHDQYQ